MRLKTLICRFASRAGLALALGFMAVAIHAGEVRVAVAANFAAPAKALAGRFEKETGHRVSATVGATGKFYAQITGGAPFDVLLAADADTPARLRLAGKAVAASRVTYATGRLVLWSAKAGFVDSRGDVLKASQFRHLALASPKLAPYGAAAVQVMARLGLLDALQPKWVMGESLGQTYAFVESGNAELGFVALSQVLAPETGDFRSGSGWLVPQRLHDPIVQDAVLLLPGRDNVAAMAFLKFITTPAAQTLIRSYGYETAP